MSKPNIVFIVLDTLRADRIFSNYNDIDSTPFIRSLLDHSIYFENCLSNSTWTLPSHINMFTGLFSTQNMLISKEPHKVSIRTPIISEILKNFGYFTLCYSENAFISKSFGLTRGFDIHIKNWNWNVWMKNDDIRRINSLLIRINAFLNKIIKSRKFLKVWEHIFYRCEKFTKDIIFRLFTNSIIHIIKNNTIQELEIFKKKVEKLRINQPSYLFFNFLTTHDPYVPLINFLRSFGISKKDFTGIRELIISPLASRLKISVDSIRLSKKKVRIIKKLYDACVISADIILKRLFSILKELRILDNSYVIITSDHGEHLGGKMDHYLWLHCTFLSSYEEVLKVPLLIFNVNFKSKIVKHQVQLKDLFHTILHLTGVSPNNNNFLDINKSILYQVENNSTPKYIYGEDLKSSKNIAHILSSHRKTLNRKLLPKIKNSHYFMRTDEYKYIKYDNCDIEEFYNLSIDPHEQFNVVDENNEEYRTMKEKMNRFIAEIKNEDELQKIITLKEKDTLQKIISTINFEKI